LRAAGSLDSFDFVRSAPRLNQASLRKTPLNQPQVTHTATMLDNSRAASRSHAASLFVQDVSRSLRLAERGAAPAGGGSSPPHSGGFGHQPSGMMTGAGVETLDWDRRARITPVERCRDLRRKAVHRIVPLPPSKRQKCPQEAWPGAEPEGDNRLARAAVERREASADCKPRAALTTRRLRNSVSRRSASFVAGGESKRFWLRRAPCSDRDASALHCRSDLTKIGLRRGFLEWLADNSGADRIARTSVLVCYPYPEVLGAKPRRAPQDKDIGSLQLRWRKGQNPAGCGV
jgi:hypothetical protein